MTEYERELFVKFFDCDKFSDDFPVGISEKDVFDRANEFVKVQCTHQLIPVYKFASNGVKLYRMQCTRCNEIIGSGMKHTPELAAQAIEEMPTRYAEIYEMQNEAKEGIVKRWKSRKDSQWWTSYNTYLNSPEWAAKRLKVFKRANWICEGCGDARATEIHHLVYTHAFNEYLFELVALCHKCHAEITTPAQRPGAR
jgi:5-methylcytosine-specific restriction endonuclease McrA